MPLPRFDIKRADALALGDRIWSPGGFWITVESVTPTSWWRVIVRCDHEIEHTYFRWDRLEVWLPDQE